MALEHEITQFGGRLGFPGLALPPEGILAFDVTNKGRVHFERVGGEILAYLTLPVPPYDRDIARRLLAMCRYDKVRPLPLGAGLHRGQAVLMTRMPEAAATAAALETAAIWLMERMAEVSKG